MTTKFKIGLDYGGTKIEGILLDESGKEIKRKRFNYNQNYETGVDVIKNLVQEFDQFAQTECSVGVGIPGSSSQETEPNRRTHLTSVDPASPVAAEATWPVP